MRKSICLVMNRNISLNWNRENIRFMCIKGLLVIMSEWSVNYGCYVDVLCECCVFQEVRKNTPEMLFFRLKNRKMRHSIRMIDLFYIFNLFSYFVCLWYFYLIFFSFISSYLIFICCIDRLIAPASTWVCTIYQDMRYCWCCCYCFTMSIILRNCHRHHALFNFLSPQPAHANFSSSVPMLDLLSSITVIKSTIRVILHFQFLLYHTNEETNDKYRLIFSSTNERIILLKKSTQFRHILRSKSTSAN